MKLKVAVFFLLFGTIRNLPAQEGFYDTDVIQEIKIFFVQNNWDHILDSLYTLNTENRLLASVEINGVHFDSVGIRYKGYSSASTSRTKNPFNIKLDYITKQDYQGIDKIKLSNVIQDPSFLREVLSYKVARNYLPSSKANFAKVYINNVYWGLYSNIETVEEAFLTEHFSSSSNCLIKGNPTTVDLNGENSNLSDNPGGDSTSYYQLYDLKSDFGWKDLLSLIDTLNNFPTYIESILNVDRTLWMHALNYALVNFDSYIGYAQNYYLYRDNNQQFNPILWDMNMSFASFRMTDASSHYDGFTISEAITIDPLQHLNDFSIFPRPLMRKLLENDSYRKRYIAHLKTIIEEQFLSDSLKNDAQYLHDLISADVANDTNKFYSTTLFENNLSGDVSDLIDYPGIFSFIENRGSYLQNYPGFQSDPEIVSTSHLPENPTAGESITFNASVLTASKVYLYYRFGKNQKFIEEEMLDDGLHNDGTPNDGIFGITIPQIGNLTQYYFYAENEEAGIFSPSRAAYKFHEIIAELNPGSLVINEIMAINENTISDEKGGYPDWVEFFNPLSYPITIGDFYLSDDAGNLQKWKFPSAVINPESYLIIWLDEDTNQSEFHANFKLSSNYDELYLSYKSSLSDHTQFYNQEADISWARIPNGTGNFALAEPTPAMNNNLAQIEKISSDSFKIYPNPCTDHLNIKTAGGHTYQVTLLNLTGQTILNYSFANQMTMDVSNLAQGYYLISAKSKTDNFNYKFFKQ